MSDRSACFARAFVGAVCGRRNSGGASVDDAAARRPAPWVDLGEQTHHRLGGAGWLVAYGHSEATLDAGRAALAVGHTVYTGRPHALGAAHASGHAHDNGAMDTVLGALDGRFAVVHFDADSVTLATDILGCGGVFHAQIDGCIYFSSHLGLLVQALPGMPAIDALGAASVAIMRGAVDGRTPFTGVLRLQAGERLRIGLVVDGPVLVDGPVPYLEMAAALSGPAPGGSEAQRFETFTELLRASVHRELECLPDAGLMLSAGKDSNAIAVTLPAPKSGAWRSATFGETGSVDLEGAARAARRFGFDHHELPYDDWRFEQQAPLIIGLGGGLSGMQTAHMTAGFEPGGKVFRSTLVGMLGDSMSGSRLAAGGIMLSRRQFVERRIMFSGMLDPVLRRAFAPEFDEVYERLVSWIEQQTQLSPHQAHIMAHFRTTQASFISSTFELCQQHQALAYPFFSRELLRFVLALSADDLREQRFYRRWAAAMSGGGVGAHTLGSRLAEAVANVKKLSVFRLHGPLARRRPPERLDWRERMQRSRTWFRAASQIETGESRIDAVMKELAQARPTRHNPASLQFVLPVALATRLQVADPAEAMLIEQ